MTRICNAFSIDVEDYFHVAALADVITVDSWGSLDYRVEANTHRLLQILDDAGVRGTFFVLGWVAKRSPQLVKDIQRAGHEIASHGMSHRLIYRQTPLEFHEETRQSKELLEDLTGVAVLGYRAASYSITAHSLWALDTLVELGFCYDSSIFPIRHDIYGIPDALPTPGRLVAPAGGTIVEFPMSTARLFGVKVPVSGGGYFRLLPYALTRAGLRQVNRESESPFVFYLHPWEIDVSQPRIRRARWTSRFRHYNNIDRCESRLRRLLQDFAFAPVSEALRKLGLISPDSGRGGKGRPWKTESHIA